MIGLDTNIVLRYVLQDDETQTRAVVALIENELNEHIPGFISLVVVLEVVWVLRSALRWSEFAIADVIEELVKTEAFLIQNEKAVYRAASAVKRNAAEFEDALIGALAAWAGCSEMVTFDRGASRQPGFRKLA